jgi:hypothetical protein
MSRQILVVISILLMALGRFMDVAVTYQFSPELTLEGNPMVTGFGLGWSFLLVANVLAVIAIGACSLYWGFKPIQYERSSEVTDIWSFASHAHFQRVYSRTGFIWRRIFCSPRSWRHTIQLLGFVTPPVVFVVSVFAVFSWYALYFYQWDAFSRIYYFFWPVYPAIIVVPTLVIATVQFYRDEFRLYSQQHGLLIRGQEFTALMPSPNQIGR